jgi:hypothetical protein
MMVKLPGSGMITEGIMNLPRRRFLHLAAGAAATTTQSAIPSPPQGQAAIKAALSKRSARDRLQEALARIADPKGGGARACLTVYSDAARAAADAADARARAGLSFDSQMSRHALVERRYAVASKAMVVKRGKVRDSGRHD